VSIQLRGWQRSAWPMPVYPLRLCPVSNFRKHHIFVNVNSLCQASMSNRTKNPIKPTETRNCIYQSGTWTLLTRQLQQQDSRQRLLATTWTEHLDALYRCSHPRRPQLFPRRCHQTCLRNTHSDVMQFITNAVLTTHSLTAMPDERGS